MSAFARRDELNPPVDQRANVEGYPTLRLPTKGQPHSLKDLSRQQRQLWSSRATGNASLISQFVSGDATLVTCTGAASRRELKAQIKAGNFRLRNYRLEDFDLQSSSSTTSVISYRAVQDAICGGKPLPSPISVTVSYIKRRGKWWIISYKESIPAASTSGHQGC